MRLIRPIRPVAAACLLLGANQEAQGQSSLPPRIVKAVGDWAACRASVAATLPSSPASAEALIDKSFQDCEKFEGEVTKVWEEIYGAGSGAQVQDLKRRLRATLIENVDAARSGRPSADPYMAWSNCVGTHLPQTVARSADASALADAALDACEAEFSRAQEVSSQRVGPETAKSQGATIRSELRKRAMALLESVREN